MLGLGDEEGDQVWRGIPLGVHAGAPPVEARPRSDRPLHAPARTVVARWLHKSVAEPAGAPLRRHDAVRAQPGRRVGVAVKMAGSRCSAYLIPVDHAPPSRARQSQKAWSPGTGAGLHDGRSSADPRRRPGASAGPDWPGGRGLATGNGRQAGGCRCRASSRSKHPWSANLLVLATQGHQDFLDALRAVPPSASCAGPGVRCWLFPTGLSQHRKHLAAVSPRARSAKASARLR